MKATKRKPSQVRSKPEPVSTFDIFSIWFQSGEPRARILRIGVDEIFATAFCDAYNKDGFAPMAVMLPSGLYEKTSRKAGAA